MRTEHCKYETGRDNHLTSPWSLEPRMVNLSLTNASSAEKRTTHPLHLRRKGFDLLIGDVQLGLERCHNLHDGSIGEKCNVWYKKTQENSLSCPSWPSALFSVHRQRNQCKYVDSMFYCPHLFWRAVPTLQEEVLINIPSSAHDDDALLGQRLPDNFGYFNGDLHKK